MQLLKRLNNFAQDLQKPDIYLQFCHLPVKQCQQLLTQINLHPTLRLVCYLRSLKIIHPAKLEIWADQLIDIKQEFDQIVKRQYEDHLYFNIFEHCADPLQQQVFVRRHKLEKLISQVDLDINRLFSGDPFFSDKQHRAAIHKVTTLWAHIYNFDIYKQGIHEIAAILYKLVYDGVASNGFSRQIDHLTQLDNSLILPLSLELVKCVMHYAYDLFADEKDFQDILTNFGHQYLDDEILQSWSKFDYQAYLQLKCEQKDEIPIKFRSIPRLKTKMNKIFYLLQESDYPIYERIQQLNIENIYLIRWLRLLFLREVPSGLVPRLWDFIIYSFVTFENLDYLDYVALQLYQNKRNLILTQDFNVLMRQFSQQSFEHFSLFQLENFMQHALASVPERGVGEVSAVQQTSNQQQLIQPLGDFQRELVMQILKSSSDIKDEQVKRRIELLSGMLLSLASDEELSQLWDIVKAQLGDNVVERNQAVRGLVRDFVQKDTTQFNSRKVE